GLHGSITYRPTAILRFSGTQLAALCHHNVLAAGVHTPLEISVSLDETNGMGGHVWCRFWSVTKSPTFPAGKKHLIRTFLRAVALGRSVSVCFTASKIQPTSRCFSIGRARRPHENS